MEFRQIADDFAVAGQIEASDVTAIAEAGFRTIICNRPDGESFGQPPHDGIEAAAAKAGLEFRYIPVVSGQITPENVADMAEALDDVPGPVLAYCRSGARCANLHGLVQQTRRD